MLPHSSQKSEYDDLVSSLFKLYSKRLEQIIAKVKQNPASANNREQIITADLKSFKTKLASTCQFYVNDIWENFQTYSKQQKSKSSGDRFSKIMNTDLSGQAAKGASQRTPTRSLSKPRQQSSRGRMATPTKLSMVSFQPVATSHRGDRDSSSALSARKTSRTPPHRSKMTKPRPALTTRTDLFTHLLDKCESRAYTRLRGDHSPLPSR